MALTRTSAFFAVCLLATALILTSGCQSRASSAQKLYDKGEYEKVMEQYPDLEIARRAHAKLADKYLQEKKYDVVLKEYGDTRAAHQARLEIADQMFKQGKYQTVLDSFPGTPAATSAKEKLADSLYQAGAYDELIARFGETPQGMKVKEQKSIEELAAANKLKGEAKKQAYEALMKKYPGTAAYKEAAAKLAEIRTAEAKKKK